MKALNMHILFLCTGNSCRSIIAEAIFNHLAPENMRAMSAGSQPTREIHPRSIALLNYHGISTEGYYSKSWDSLPATPDIVITVCSHAAAETCPTYLGNVMRAHWGADDPAQVYGTDAQIQASFEQTYHLLRRRIESCLQLDHSVWNNREDLQTALENIGHLT